MELYTRAEAARRLKIGLRTLDRRLANGHLACHRFGDGPRAPVRISEEQIQAYLKITISSGPEPSSDEKRRAEAFLGPRRHSA